MALPYNIFSKNDNQYSIYDLNEENRSFLWHRFMLDLLSNIPRSSNEIENVIEACQLVYQDEPDKINATMQADLNKFRTNYSPNDAINW